MNTNITSKGEKAKRHIYKHALELFRIKGYDNTTLNDICNAAEIANGTFYHYFGSKTDICKEHVQKETEAVLTHYNSASYSSSTEELKGVVHLTVNNMVSNNRSMYRAIIMSELKSNQQSFKLVENTHIESLLKIIIKKGQEKGEFKNSQSSEYHARMIISSLTWHILGWCSSDDDKILLDFLDILNINIQELSA